MAVVAGVVLLQKDLGTALVICGSVFLLLFAAGLPLRHLAWTGLAGAAATAFFIFGEAYRRTRFLEAWLNSELDPSGAGWQLRQGLIALGSGGWFGVGLGNSRQKWDYLPNAHSDFVFAVLGEELGLIGALAVLSLFGVLLFAGIRIAMNAHDTFGRLLAAGITGWIGLQTLVNLGAVTGLLPITGVPLPFLSFGGTALVVTLAGVGVIASVGLEGVRSAERRHARDRSRSGGGGSGSVRIVIAGGGTAGHVVPSIAVADRLREGGASVEFVGSPGRTGSLDSCRPPATAFHAVAAAPFRREISVRSAAAPFVALRSVASVPADRARRRRGPGDGRVREHRPGRSPPAPCGCRRSLHEQNAIPGLANRLLARLATAMALTFEDSRARLPRSLRVEVTGLPLRRDIREVTARREELAAEARRTWDLEPERTTVLVTGGSQGASTSTRRSRARSRSSPTDPICSSSC